MKKMKPAIRAFLKGIARRIDASDFLFIAGAGVISYGIAMVYRPAGVIIAGVFLIILSVSTSKPKTGR